MFKLQRPKPKHYTRTRTYHIILIIVFCLCVGIAAMAYEVINKSEDLPFISTAVTLLLLGVILIAVLELFDNLQKEEAYIEAKTVFLSVASHDLHSPLTGINWAAHALAMQAKDPKQKERLLAIEQSSRTVLQTVDDALSITNLERLAKQKVMRTNVDLLELLDGVINGFRLTAAQKNITIARIGKWPSSYEISVDEKQFRRVIANILSDEAKYADPNSSVSVSFAERKDSWSIAFHNVGPTISKEDQKNIFALNHRTKESEQSGTHGVGFGLYLAQQIILEHKGIISVTSADDSGTMFTITMPKIINT
jgi:two-component system phosphate regulon sensor histidine kinase PhoR